MMSVGPDLICIAETLPLRQFWPEFRKHGRSLQKLRRVDSLSTLANNP